MKISHNQAMDMARLCSHGKGDGFIEKKKWKGKRGKDEMKNIKGCMQLRKIGMCEVMADKAMESGLQDMDDEGAMKDKYG